MKIRYKTDIRPLGIVLIVVGFLFLLETFNILKGVYKLWPVFPLILGIGFWILFANYGKKEIPLVGIGTFIVLISLLFFYLNFTFWSQLAHLWQLFLIFIGLSFLSIYIYQKKGIFIYLSSLFIIIGFVFFLVFSITAKLWPISLILLGASLWLIREKK